MNSKSNMQGRKKAENRWIYMNTKDWTRLSIGESVRAVEDQSRVEMYSCHVACGCPEVRQG